MIMDKHCGICHNTSCSNHGKNISFLGEGWKCNYIPVPTNADRIRAMSDEELAAWLTRIANGDVYTDFCCNPARTVVCDSKCVVCIAEWLKHPAKDGDDDD